MKKRTWVVLSPARVLFAVVCIIALLSFVSAESEVLHAAPLRPPTEKEREILTKYKSAVHGVLSRFADENWIEIDTHKFDVDDDFLVSSDPDVPLDINESMQMEYRIGPHSPLYRQQFAPAMEKIEATSDIQEKMKLMEALPAGQIEVLVHFNRANLSLDAETKSAAFILKGAAMGYKEPGKTDRDGSALLLFGDWQSANWVAGNGWYHFHFQRKGRYPAIENIEIELRGSRRRIDELLRTIDWQKVNAGLSLAQ
jgi:hypothetical protein